MRWRTCCYLIVSRFKFIPAIVNKVSKQIFSYFPFFLTRISLSFLTCIYNFYKTKKKKNTNFVKFKISKYLYWWQLNFLYRLLRYDENQKWIMNGNIYKLKILFRCDNKKNKKIRSIITFYLLLADSWRFKLIKKKMMPMREGYRREREKRTSRK